jgi:hypothetical protein
MRLEPLRAQDAVRSELLVPPPLHEPVAALEGEQLLVPERGEALAGTVGRADLDAVLEADVVDDIHPRHRRLDVGAVAHPPLADGADPPGRIPHPLRGPARDAGGRQQVGHADLALDPVVRDVQVQVAQAEGCVR